MKIGDIVMARWDKHIYLVEIKAILPNGIMGKYRVIRPHEGIVYNGGKFPFDLVKISKVSLLSNTILGDSFSESKIYQKR